MCAPRPPARRASAPRRSGGLRGAIRAERPPSCGAGARRSAPACLRRVPARPPSHALGALRRVRPRAVRLRLPALAVARRRPGLRRAPLRAVQSRTRLRSSARGRPCPVSGKGKGAPCHAGPRSRGALFRAAPSVFRAGGAPWPARRGSRPPRGLRTCTARRWPALIARCARAHHRQDPGTPRAPHVQNTRWPPEAQVNPKRQHQGGTPQSPTTAAAGRRGVLRHSFEIFPLMRSSTRYSRR